METREAEILYAFKMKICKQIMRCRTQKEAFRLAAALVLGFTGKGLYVKTASDKFERCLIAAIENLPTANEVNQ
jgi:hypothetical protein